MQTFKQFNEMTNASPAKGDRVSVESDRIIDNGPWSATIDDVLENNTFSIYEGEYEFLPENLTKIREGVWSHE